jgi:hypothetical protein
MSMNEIVGSCEKCGKKIYCLDGFLNGVHTKEGKVLCFECDREDEGLIDGKNKKRKHLDQPRQA